MSSRLLRAVPAVLLLAAAAAAEEPPAGPARPSPPEGAERERLRSALPLPVVKVSAFIGVQLDDIVDENVLRPARSEEEILAELLAAQEGSRASPEDPEAWIRLARSEESRGNRAGAATAWKRTVDLLRALPEPSLSEGAALLRLGECLVGAGDPAAAIPRLEKAAAAPGATAETAALLGRAYLEDSLRRLRPEHPDPGGIDPEGFMAALRKDPPTAASIREWREGIERAAGAFDQAVAAGPGRVDLLQRRLHARFMKLCVPWALQDSGSTPQALREGLEPLLADLVLLRDALPSRAELGAKVLVLRMGMGVGLGDLSEEAIRERGPQVVKTLEAEAEALSKAVPTARGRARAEILSALVLFYAARGTDPEKVQALAREAAAADPREDRPWLLGLAPLLKDRDLPAMLRYCEQRLAAHDSVQFRLIAAKASALTGKPADALRHAEAALALDGTDGRAILMLAAILARRGDPESVARARVALAPLDRGIAAEPAEHRACVATLRGLVLALEGFRTEGVAEVRRALEIAPDYTPAKDALRALEGK